jgi:DNA topoisomerase-1
MNIFEISEEDELQTTEEYSDSDITNTHNVLLKYFLGLQFDHDIKKHNIIGGAKKTENKWKTLKHNGVVFQPLYERRNVPIIYNNKNIYLNDNAEEAAFLYAKYIGSEYSKSSTFNKNFYNDWKKMFKTEEEKQIKNLSECDFSKIVDELEKEKSKKLKQKEIEKEKPKTDTKLDAEDKYSVAVVDGIEQPVANYIMEPVGIFLGRGKNPNLGKIKRRIVPEDIIINIGKDETPPKLPEFYKNHGWGKIINNRQVEWLASFHDTITNKIKYVWLSHDSHFKSQSDSSKFEIARKLKKKIKKIREANDENMKSDDIKIKQIATAFYFVDKLALRIGNEKSEDTADTVGVTSLRNEHVTLLPNNTIELDFLGKDSVRYHNKTVVEKQVYDNIKEFKNKKEPYEELFNFIKSSDVNKYLQSFMKDLTAKLFRTYHASHMFQKELNKILNKFPSDDKQKWSTAEILDEYTKANIKVAQLMNHQKNITKNDKSGEKIDEMIKKLRAKLKKTTKDSVKATIKEKIQKYKSKKELKKSLKNISLGTSKINYIDPRITISFMKKFDLPIEKVFSKTLQTKFKWAFDADVNFNF